MFNINRIVLAVVAVIFFAGFGGSALAQPKDMKGWEADSPYNQLYSVQEMDEFKVHVDEFTEEEPMPGMSPALVMFVKDMDGEKIKVHVGPKWFVDSIGVRKGDQVKIRGAWAELDGKDIFMLSKLKGPNDYEYKIRLTKDGKPFWLMTPEELQKERMP